MKLINFFTLFLALTTPLLNSIADEKSDFVLRNKAEDIIVYRQHQIKKELAKNKTDMKKVKSLYKELEVALTDYEKFGGTINYPFIYRDTLKNIKSAIKSETKERAISKSFPSDYVKSVLQEMDRLKLSNEKYYAKEFLFSSNDNKSKEVDYNTCVNTCKNDFNKDEVSTTNSNKTESKRIKISQFRGIAWDIKTQKSSDPRFEISTCSGVGNGKKIDNYCYCIQSKVDNIPSTGTCSNYSFFVPKKMRRKISSHIMHEEINRHGPQLGERHGDNGDEFCNDHNHSFEALSTNNFSEIDDISGQASER